MFFRQITDPDLAQHAYLIGCQRTGEALVIDPQRDIERYIRLAEAENLRITAVTETHIHADFLSGVREFAERLGVTVYLSGEGGPDWQYSWPDPDRHALRLLKHGDTFRVGLISFKAVHTPGHTPEHLSFLITDRGGGADAPMGLASGDFVFVGDLGRPDLLETAAGHVGTQEPAARALFDSVQGFLNLPDYLQVWPGHGAGSACGKALGAVPETTVGYERRFNGAIDAARRGPDAFVEAILEGQSEPPLYFARMKRENKTGPALLGQLPDPQPLSIEEVQALAGRTDIAVLDTRLDRSAFMEHHLPGSLYAPLDKTFPTVAGSYVWPDQSIYLLVEDAGQVETAVLDLIRIGLDRVEGFAPVDVLHHVKTATTPTLDMNGLERERGTSGTNVLDVRGAHEFGEAHVPGALNIAHTRLLDRKAELDPNSTYLVHCRSGARAAVATALLERYGFNTIYVDGAFADWQTQASKKRFGFSV